MSTRRLPGRGSKVFVAPTGDRDWVTGKVIRQPKKPNHIQVRCNLGFTVVVPFTNNYVLVVDEQNPTFQTY